MLARGCRVRNGVIAMQQLLGCVVGWCGTHERKISVVESVTSRAILDADQPACRNRVRSRSKLARPYIWRLISFSRLICPST